MIVYTDFGKEPWLLVPMLGQATFLSPSGAVKAKLDVGARANYFVQQRPGPLLVDSDVQLLLDVPRISVGDVDGDGKADVVSSAPSRRARVPAAGGQVPRGSRQDLQARARLRAGLHPRLGRSAQRGARHLGRRPARPDDLAPVRRHHRREVRHAHLPEPRRCMEARPARLRRAQQRRLGRGPAGRHRPRRQGRSCCTWRCRSACST